MPIAPRLDPVAPTPGSTTVVDRSPFLIGAGPACALRLYLPGVADRAASITEREDGYYLSPFPGAPEPRVDGHTIHGPTRLRDRDVIEFAAAARFEFVTGEARTEAAPPPVPATLESEPPKRKRRRRRVHRKGGTFPAWAIAAIVLLLAVAGVGGYVVVRTWFAGSTSDEGPPPLTQVEGQLYDSLMSESTRSIERGSTLLGLGLREAALREFAEALTSFETSPLRNNSWVRPRIDALAHTIATVYEANRLAIPDNLRRGRSSLTDLSRSLSARLTVPQFSAAVSAVRATFRDTFHADVRVTGTDHPEHLSLYGPGGAMDMGVKELPADQVEWLVAHFNQAGVRVKDFSRDNVLRAEIAAAIRSGKLDQAGTALHIHLDRFADHSDRWTTR